MVYGRLCRYAGRDGAVYPAIPTLGSELGIGKTQARQYVQELEREHFTQTFLPTASGAPASWFFQKSCESTTTAL